MWFEVAFAPDGKSIATAGRDKTVRIWNINGEALHTLEHPGGVSSFSFLPDGKQLAAACYQTDTRIRIWDLQTASVKKELTGHEIGGPPLKLAVQKISVSPDGAKLASCGGDGSVRLWDVQHGKELKEVHRFKSWSGGVEFSPDGKLLTAFCFDEGSIILYDLTKESVLHKFSTRPLARPCFSPEGRSFFYDDSDNQSIHEYDIASATEKNVYPSGTGEMIYSLAVSPDGKTLAWSSKDNDQGTVRFVSLRSEKTTKGVTPIDEK